MSAPILMRVSIAGYSGKPASVFGAYDRATDVLAVIRESPIEDVERPGFLRITNNVRDSWVDALFSEEHFQDAIKAFFELQSLGLLSISAKAQRAEPGTKIERDGLDSNGVKYRIAPDMSNAQVATLAACWYAGQQRAAAVTSEFAADVMGLMSI